MSHECIDVNGFINITISKANKVKSLSNLLKKAQTNQGNIKMFDEEHQYKIHRIY